MNPCRQAIIDWLATSGALPGYRLPSLRILADILNLSFSEVRNAVISLEESGIIERRSPRIFIVKQSQLTKSAACIDFHRDVVVLSEAASSFSSDLNSTAMQPALFQSTIKALRASGLHPLALPIDDITPDRIDHVSRTPPLGWIILGAAPAKNPLVRELMKIASKSGRPVVVHADLLPLEMIDDINADLVSADQASGAAAIISHLAASGRTRIQPILLPSHRFESDWFFSTNWFTERMKGYTNQANSLGLTLLPSLPWLAPPRADTRRDMDEASMIISGVLIESLRSPMPPDALIAMEDRRAAILGLACQRLGHRIAVAGFDNTWETLPESAWGPQPQVTWDRQIGNIGGTLVKLLLRRLAEPNSPRMHIRSPGRIVVNRPE